MRFKGDIIITDPCYIMKEDKTPYPDLNDYVQGVTGSTAFQDYTKEQKEQYKTYEKLTDKYWEDHRKNDDWGTCNYGDNMEVLGINTYLTSSTEYGDWSCTTIKDDEKSKELVGKMNEHYLKFFHEYNFTGKTNEEKEKLSEQFQKERAEFNTSDLVLGHFCADAGLVSVFLLEEVLKYNPDFDYHLNNLHTTTLIKDFDGDIEITHRKTNGVSEELDEEYTEESDYEISVIGKGNVNFYTTQTGF